MRRTGPFLACAILLLAACGGEVRTPPPSTAESADAAAVTAAIEADIRALGGMALEARMKAELAFGPRLERDLEACRGTRYENMPLYLLAQWLVAHGGDDDSQQRVLGHLDRLEILPSPAYHLAGRALRVQALLNLGRLAEAKQMATSVQRDLPEAGVAVLIAFHDQVGSPAPELPGVAAAEGQANDSAPLLVAFLPGVDAASESWLAQWTAVKGLRVCAVVGGGDLLAAGTAAGRWGCDVRWLRPGDGSLAAWKVPSLPTAVLLGPGRQRLILAIAPRPAKVAASLAVKPR